MFTKKQNEVNKAIACALSHEEKYSIDLIAEYISQKEIISKKEFYRVTLPFLLKFKIFEKKSPYVLYNRKLHYKTIIELTEEDLKDLKWWKILPNTWKNLLPKIRSVD